ncbi:MAG: hypothetical protein R2761_28050 [Acidimicrobiales bacterium]
MIAHVGGVPVEELLPVAATAVTGAGAYAMLRLSSLWARLRAEARRKAAAAGH